MAFSDLDMDVILHLLEYIADTDWTTLKSLSFVNKTLNRATKTFKHRRKCLVLARINSEEDVISNSERLIRWSSHENVLRGLKCLSIETYPDTAYPRIMSTEVAHLETLLSKIGRLKHLHWKAHVAVPFEVLEALHKYQPKVQLKVSWWIRAEKELGPDDKAELALAHSPALTYIVANGQARYNHWSDDTIEGGLNRMVASAPNLSSVVLRHSAWRCCRACYKHRYPQRLVEVDEKNTSFYKNIGKSSSIRTLVAYGDLDDFVHTYEQLIDLTKLSNVAFRFARAHAPNFFYQAPSLMPNLLCLTLRMHIRKEELDHDTQEAIDEALNYYLTVTVPPLESLHITAKPGVVTLFDIITHHGPTLRSFGFHHRDRNRGPPKQSIKAEEIDALKKSAPMLSSLDFDIQRRSESLIADLEYYKPVFEAIASLDLQTLVIHMDVGLELHGYPDLKGVGPVSTEMPPLHYLPPSNSRGWAPMSSTSYAPETDDTDVRKFAESIWRIVFGGSRGGGERKLRLHFEEWDYWWRIRGGRRINVKEQNCVRSLWTVEGKPNDDGEVQAKHVSTWHGRGNESRVADREEFIA